MWVRMRPRLSLRQCWGGGNEGGLGRQDLPGPGPGKRRRRRRSVTCTDGAQQGRSCGHTRLNVIPTFCLKCHTQHPMVASGSPRPRVTLQVALKHCPKNTSEPAGEM